MRRPQIRSTVSACAAASLLFTGGVSRTAAAVDTHDVPIVAEADRDPSGAGSEARAPRVAATIAVDPVSWPGAVLPDGSALYVSSYGAGTVSVIDTARNEVSTRIAVGADPSAGVLTPDGSALYVPNGLGAGARLSVIDTASNTVTATIPIGGRVAEPGLMLPDGSAAYFLVDVSRENEDNGGDGEEQELEVWVIDTATNTVDATIPVSRMASFGGVLPDGSEVHVADGDRYAVLVIDTASNRVTKRIPLREWPTQAVTLPDGSAVYVLHRDAGTVSVIDTARNAVTRTIRVGGWPQRQAVLPDGSAIYIPDEKKVSVLDTVRNQVTKRIRIVGSPDQAVALPDGSAVVLSGFLDGTVSVIDTVSNEVVATVEVGDFAEQGVPLPDGSAVYVPGERDEKAMLWVIAGRITPSSASRRPREYQVRPGDSLWGIAARELGEPERWPEILDASREVRQPDGRRLTDPNLIRPGWVLRLGA